MSAGTFLQKAWNTTADGAHAAMDNVGGAVSTAVTDVKSAARAAASVIVPALRVSAVVVQIPTTVVGLIAQRLINKATYLFSPNSAASVQACLATAASRLAADIRAEQALIAKAIANGQGNNPAVLAAQAHVAVSLRALMSADAYKDGQQLDIPGYHRATQADLNRLRLSAADLNPNSGMHAALYVSNDGNQYTLAYRGTDPSVRSDLVADASQAMGVRSPYYEDAQSLAGKVNQQVAENAPGSTLDLAGHSLGGGEVQAASSATGLTGTTFNAAGLNPSTVESFDASALRSQVTNYTVQGEPLTSVQQSVIGLPSASAQQVVLPAPAGDVGTMALHSMDSVENGLSQSSPAIQQSLFKLGHP